MEVTVRDIPASDEKILSEAKSDSPNPQNYAWEVTRPCRSTADRFGGRRRVFADLHHQSLNVSKHEPFSPKEDNPIFYHALLACEPKETGKKAEKKK